MYLNKVHGEPPLKNLFLKWPYGRRFEPCYSVIWNGSICPRVTDMVFNLVYCNEQHFPLYQNNAAMCFLWKAVARVKYVVSALHMDMSGCLDLSGIGRLLMVDIWNASYRVFFGVRP